MNEYNEWKRLWSERSGGRYSIICSFFDWSRLAYSRATRSHSRGEKSEFFEIIKVRIAFIASVRGLGAKRRLGNRLSNYKRETTGVRRWPELSAEGSLFLDKPLILNYQ